MLALTCSVILDHFCSLPCLIYLNEFCHFLPSFTLSFFSKKQIITCQKKALLEDHHCEINWNCIIIRVTLTHIQTGLLILECNTIFDKNCKRPEAQNDLKLIFSTEIQPSGVCLLHQWNRITHLVRGSCTPSCLLRCVSADVIAPRSQKMHRADNEPTKTKRDKDTRGQGSTGESNWALGWQSLCLISGSVSLKAWIWRPVASLHCTKACPNSQKVLRSKCILGMRPRFW